MPGGPGVLMRESQPHHRGLCGSARLNRGLLTMLTSLPVVPGERNSILCDNQQVGQTFRTFTYTQNT